MSFVLPEISAEDLASLPSPRLVIFKERLDANLETMLRMAKSPDRLRPHCKTHKMEQIIRMWVARGVLKHKAATIAECEMVANAGGTDILFAYNPVGPNIARIVALAKKFPGSRFTVTADNESPLKALSEHAAAEGVVLGVLVDINLGMDRTGVPPESDAARTLCALAARLPGIRFAGFHLYDGHHRQHTLEDRKAAVAAEWPRVTALRAWCESQGIPVPAISCGGTPTFPCYAEMDDPAIELCPGTCVFHDAGYGVNFPDLPFSPAAMVLTRVVSRPASNRLTLDIGNKAVAADPPKGARLAIPAIPDAVQDVHSEEHLGLITDLAKLFQPGDAMLAIPMHICPTCALYDRAAVVEHGQVTEYWDVSSRNRRLTI